MKRILFLCFPFLWVWIVSAQDHYAFSVIDAAQGLSDNRVRYILQLQDGRMVFTTDEGLNLYDGTSFSYLHRQEGHIYPLRGYTGSYHEYLYEDSLLWIKDYQRLMRVNFRRDSYETRLDGVFRALGTSDSVCDLFVDKQQTLWLVTKGDKLLCKRQGAHSVSEFLSGVSRLPGGQDPLYDLLVLKSHLYLFYKSGLMICYDLKSRREQYRQDAFPDEESRSLYGLTSLVIPATNGFYQLRNGWSNGMFLYFDLSTRTWETILETPYRLNTLVVGREGRMVWIAHQHGLLSWDTQTRKLNNIPVLRLVDGRKIYTELNTLFYDSQGGLWIGTLNRGVLYYHPDRFKIRNIGRALFPGFIEENLQVLAFAEGNRGEIYLQCNDGSCFRYDARRTILEPCQPGREVEQALKRKRSIPSFQGKAYTSLLRDSRGWMWAGTSDGLKLWKPSLRRWQVLYAEDGLVNNSVRALLEDRDHAVWVSTSNGLSRITTGVKGELHFTNFTRQDGTLEGEFDNCSALAASDGILYFGGLDGFNQIDLKQIASDTTALRPLCVAFYLYGLKVRQGVSYDGNVILNQALPYTRELVLNYDQNFFMLCFSGLNYINPSQTNYRFRLWGVDDEWREQRSPDGLLRAIYTDLKPGTYRFQVYASGSGKLWNGPFTEMEIVVKAPFWATSWAYSLYAVSFVLLLSLGIYFYLWYKKKQLGRRHKEEILLLRIKNLLEQCNRYQEQLMPEPELLPEPEDDPLEVSPKVSPSIESVEEKMRNNVLLTRAVELIEQNLENMEYSVEQLSRDLCMDRTGLYRKLTSLIDKSPTFLIRSIRLKRAAELLAGGNLSVAEVAFRVGFSSSAYLSKCFQDEYGMKPSKYAESKRTECEAKEL